MDIPSLKRMVEEDERLGFQPFLIVGTVGAVNMGAIDDLKAIAEFIAEKKEKKEKNSIWFHIDGAFGASVQFGKLIQLEINLADSLAFDFHKWLQVNYDAGCVLIKGIRGKYNIILQ